MTEVTRILSRIEQGDADATERLLPLVYEELREMAAAKLSREQPGNEGVNRREPRERRGE